MADIPCSEKGCDGVLDFKNAHYLPSIRYHLDGWEPIYPCNKCYTLHDENGKPLKTRRGEKSFLKNGVIWIRRKKPRKTKQSPQSQPSPKKEKRR